MIFLQANRIIALCSWFVCLRIYNTVHVNTQVAQHKARTAWMGDRLGILGDYGMGLNIA